MQPQAWTYAPEDAHDLGGADTIHHIVDGDRHVAEVATREDAQTIVAVVNAHRVPTPPTDEQIEDLAVVIVDTGRLGATPAAWDIADRIAVAILRAGYQPPHRPATAVGARR